MAKTDTSNFDRKTWAQIQYQSILMQYEKPEVATNLFDDAYFSAVEKRYEAKFAIMTKLGIAYMVTMIVLALSAFGMNPEISQLGVTVKVDLARELLLWMAAVISVFMALIHNDVTLMKAMLLARIRLAVDKGPFKAPLFHRSVRGALGLRYMDTYGEHLPAHNPPFPEMDTAWNKRRAAIIALIALSCLAFFIASNIGLMLYVIYKVWNEPAVEPWLTRSICVFAFMSNLLWVALGIGYRTKSSED